MLCSFELAMLDFEEAMADVESRGWKSAHARVYRRLVRQKKWSSEWLLEQFTLVSCALSGLPAATRELIALVGDRAMSIDFDTLNAAQNRLQATKTDKIQEDMEG